MSVFAKLKAKTVQILFEQYFRELKLNCSGERGKNKGLIITEAEEGQSKDILKIQKNILNRNVFLRSLSKSLTNLKNYCKS